MKLKDDQELTQLISTDNPPVEEKMDVYERRIYKKGLIEPKTEEQSALLGEIIACLVRKDWGGLKVLIEQNPMVLDFSFFSGSSAQKLAQEKSLVPKTGFELTPNLFYFIQSFADDSQEFNDLFLEIARRKEGSKQSDFYFRNTPFTYAVALDNTTVITILFDYYKDNNQTMLIEENGNHNDAKNTPLLLAIKNGNTELALRLILYYAEEDLMQFTNYGNSALHLASYLKLNSVIKAIIERARDLGCVDELIKQPNLNKFIPITLYRAGFKSEEPGESTKYFFERNPKEGHNPHDPFSRFMEEVGKHGFQYEKHGEGIKKEIKNLLKPTRIEGPRNLMYASKNEAQSSQNEASSRPQVSALPDRLFAQRNEAQSRQVPKPQENNDWSCWAFLQWLLELICSCCCSACDVEESESKVVPI